MRNFLLLVLIIISNVLCKGEINIKMEKDGNVYRIPCLVNGAKMKLLFDTGASVVSLSLPMAEYLFDNGYISNSDFRGEGQTVVADGKIVDHLKLNLKDIEISGIHLSNVEAVVIASQNAPLLLGQSAIQKLGRIQLNGDVLVLLDCGRETAEYRVLSNDSEINGLVSEADELYFMELYRKALPIYELLHANNILNDLGKERLALCYLHEKEYSKCIATLDTMDEWKYGIYALAYEGIGDRDNAILYNKKNLKLAQDNNDYESMASCNFNLGSLYYDFGDRFKQKDFKRAIDHFQNALTNYEAANGIQYGNIWKQCIGGITDSAVANLRHENQTIDFLTYMLADSLYNEAQWTFEELQSSLKALAKNKNKIARDLCDNLGLVY